MADVRRMNSGVPGGEIKGNAEGTVPRAIPIREEPKNVVSDAGGQCARSPLFEFVWYGQTRVARQLEEVRGFTLLELLIVMMVTGIVLAIAVPRTRAALDRAVVRSAASDVRATLGLARTLALAGYAEIVVEIDSAAGTLVVRRGSAVLRRRGVEQAHGIELRGTRDSLTYDPYGMGRGLSNLSILIWRGSAAETVFVSRLGRIR